MDRETPPQETGVSEDLEPEREELLVLARALEAEVRRADWHGRIDLPARTHATHQPDARAAEKDSAPTPARSAADVRSQASACRDLASLAEAVSRCEACELARTRTQTVFMDGEGSSGLMFVGEAPGADEDRIGRPFVGRAGQLLTDIVTKGMGLARDEVYIANVLKCRPPGNRDPSSFEKETCTPWLERQIELTDPRVIVPLGKHAANFLLGLSPETPMGRTRGRVHSRDGRTLVPTFHPAYLLRSPGEKKECWKDIQVAMGALGIEPPARRPPIDGGSPEGGSPEGGSPKGETPGGETPRAETSET